MMREIEMNGQKERSLNGAQRRAFSADARNRRDHVGFDLTTSSRCVPDKRLVETLPEVCEIHNELLKRKTAVEEVSNVFRFGRTEGV